MEWSLVVRSADKPRLLAELLESAPLRARAVPSMDDPDDHLLAVMGALYAGDDDAYTHFERWLVHSVFPFTHDCSHGR
jgi:hypothetical protein